MESDHPIINFSFPRTVATGIMTFLAKVLVCPVVRVLYAMRIKGRKNLRSIGHRGFITVSNHCLYAEPIFAGMTIWPRRLWYCAEQKNMERTYIGWLCRIMGAFGIPEDRPLSVTTPILKALKKKHVVHIYPEGVLYHRNQNIAPFFPGAFHFALAADVPVLPMTEVLHERKAWRIFPWLPPRVEYIIGTPLYPEPFLKNSESRKEAMKAFSEAIHAAMQNDIDENGGIYNLPGRQAPPEKTDKKNRHSP